MGRESVRKGKEFMCAIAKDVSAWSGSPVSLARSPRSGDFFLPEGFPFFFEAKNDKRWGYKQWLPPAETAPRAKSSNVMRVWFYQLLTDWACAQREALARDEEARLPVPALVFTRSYEPIWILHMQPSPDGLCSGHDNLIPIFLQPDAPSLWFIVALQWPVFLSLSFYHLQVVVARRSTQEWLREALRRFVERP